MRDRMSGFPYDVEKKDGKTIIRFYPKGENLLHPDTAKFTLVLGKEDLKKLAKLG